MIVQKMVVWNIADQETLPTLIQRMLKAGCRIISTVPLETHSTDIVPTPKVIAKRGTILAKCMLIYEKEVP